MTDSWKSPKYAPNSDIEPDLKEDSDSSDYETPIEPQVKAASDPWNDPEDDDEEEEDDSFMRNNTSPDYLSSTKTNDNGQLKGNGAWDALHSEDEDTEEDDIPAGLTVRGREIKDLSRNQSTGPNVTANGEATDMGHIDHESSEEPQRKRQRTDNADELMPEQAVANTNQRSESENNRAVPHNIPPRPSYPALNPTSGSHAPPKGHMSSTQAMGRVHPSRQAPHHPTPGLIMSSFFGITPRDEFVRIIGEWLLKVCHGLAGVEIEFKFGTLVDRNTKKRISLPCLSETILPENFDCLFLSEMTERQHATLNQCLNKEVEYCSGRAGPHPNLPPHSYYPITYKHTYTTDTFFSASQNAIQSGYHQAKRRVTTDDKTGQVVEVMEKCKIANLNIFSPNEEFDWRVSVNIEIPAEVHPNERSGYARRKDRVSYKHSLFQIDLTQVNKPLNAGAPPPTHELEIEVLDASDLLTQGWNDGQGLPNQFEPQLISLLNTVRLLNRNAGPKFSQPPKRQP